ncbi:MAG: ATP-binding cassette domain-containing protein [Proteobacteria bacterium]|nr:ATP-binding cassette domain-containing protein [Pseudomonadota bacterium]
MSIIKVEKLTKIYKSHISKPGVLSTIKSIIKPNYVTVKALKEISFSVTKGEMVAYVGPNGAGKTTTSKILSGILYPTSGRVSVMGYIPWKRENNYLSQITFIMGQKTQLWWDIAPMETFLLNKSIYKISESDFEKTLDELTTLLDVKDLVHIPVRKLSLGERMKMELISSLLHKPKVLFLDEPTIGLDLLSQEAIRKFILEYNKSYNATIILTSHYIKDIEIADRIILLYRGEIIFDGNKEEILERFIKKRLVTVTFNTMPEIAKIPYNIISREGQTIEVEIEHKEISKFISFVFKSFDVKDVKNQDMNLEDAIKEGFKNASLY